VVTQTNADLVHHCRVFHAFLWHGGLLGACEYACVLMEKQPSQRFQLRVSNMSLPFP
jgi:hypothetical protein